ncbi:hypothetical protein H257_02759 [Aphanomyces astaci]|uniref:HTH psq-type domain-containing protein n=1 Tax=Aphanomyces astaci TaxID=112090 RepID=W4H2X2_APHAT|nr:hypothetical protein H257_02759 [Aphanomyces astaci]ETV86380.1 hypothetical protein H257_02759 [Aphanomyces astaci]|eukprot:XP_009824852.1 hypothetical protein H257_02759 [Aphanomyces astaci]
MPSPQRMGLSRQYSKEKLLEASADVISGTLLSKQASVKYAIPQRTIQKYVAILRLGQSAPERQRPGPKPVMPAASSSDTPVATVYEAHPVAASPVAASPLLVL